MLCSKLRTKASDFYLSSSVMEYDCIGVVETWLSEDISSSEYFLDSYTVFRKDRQFDVTEKTRGGGVILAVKKSFITSSLNLDLINKLLPSIDCVGCRIKLGSTYVFIFCIYIPPDVAICDYEYFFELLPTYFTEATNVLLMGDFNAPDWCNNSVKGPKCEVLGGFFEFSSLRQFNGVRNDFSRTLDLIICSTDCRVFRDNVPFVLEDRYHSSLVIEVNFKTLRDKNFSCNTAARIHNFKSADLLGLYGALAAIDWTELECIDDVDEACVYLYGVIYGVFDLYVPTHKIRNSSSYKYPPWYNNEIRNDIRLKYRYYTSYKSSRELCKLQKFGELRKVVKNKIKSAYKNYIDSIQNSLVSETKGFWKFIQDRRGNTRIPHVVRDAGGTTHDNPTDIVNNLAEYFSSVYYSRSSRSSRSSVLRPQSHLPVLDLWDYYLNEDLKYEPSYDLEIIQMDCQQEEESEAADGIISKSSHKVVTLGYDGINKSVPDAFSHLLEEIHKLEAELGHLPQKWKILWDKLELPTNDSLTRHPSFSTALVRSHGRLLHKRSTLEILMRGKMVGAAESSMIYSHPHRFERYNYTTPTYCDLCANVLWGPVKTGMRCMDCGYSCHEKFMEGVPKNCTKYKAVADGNVSQTLTRSGGDNGSVSSGSARQTSSQQYYEQSNIAHL